MEKGSKDYVCTLEPKYIKKARDELNENESDRPFAIESLRSWVLEQKSYLIFDTSSGSLLRILRHAKFSQIKAREMVENVAKLRYNHPEWFKNIDNQRLKGYFEKGHIIRLPGYDDDGRIVIINRISAMLPMEEILKQYTIDDLIKGWHGFFYHLMDDDMLQVNGMVMFIDMTGLNLKAISAMKDPKMTKFHKESKDSLVGRLKAFHYYNIGSLFEALFSIFSTFMKAKHKARIRVHETLESIYEHIPKRMIPLEYLPDDYKGQSAGHLQTLIDEQVKLLTSDKMRRAVLDWSNIEYFYDPSKKSNTPTEVQHFRKLNVD